VVPRPDPRLAFRRRAGSVLVTGLALGFAGVLGLGPRPPAPALAAPRAAEAPAVEAQAPAVGASAAEASAAEASAAVPGPSAAAASSAPPPVVAPRADAAFDRRGHTAFAGGYLAVTPDFASADGVYDVVIHFHGNTELVEQSFAHAKINAVFIPQNWGLGSGVYETRFAGPRAFPELLARVQAAMEKRGLRGARLGRVALTAWSAGYGAVLRILEQPALAERIDAVILLDCLHIGRVAGKRRPAVEQLGPWERFARAAMDGRRLLTITHSDITPDAFVGAHDTTDLLLRRLGVLRYAGGEEAVIPALPAVEGVLPKRLRLPLQPLSLADRGQLFVRAYAGDEPEHHIYHLMEMATIALPDLSRWWKREREASP
jgi:hypothetical protein